MQPKNILCCTIYSDFGCIFLYIQVNITVQPESMSVCNQSQCHCSTKVNIKDNKRQYIKCKQSKTIKCHQSQYKARTISRY